MNPHPYFLLLICLVACSHPPSPCPELREYQENPIRSFGDFYINDVSQKGIQRPIEDNLIYKAGYRQTWKYEYVKDHKSIQFCVDPLKDLHGTYLAGHEDCNDSTYVKRIELSVPLKTPDRYGSPDEYTPYIMKYISNADSEILEANTGAAENYKNVVLHPFRKGLCFETFNAAWPMIKFPMEIGKSWSYSRKGRYYKKDKRSDHIYESKYIIKGCQDYELLAHGIVRTVKVEFTTLSNTEKVTGHFLFSPTFGFLELFYVLPDKSRLRLYVDAVSGHDQ